MQPNPINKATEVSSAFEVREADYTLNISEEANIGTRLDKYLAQNLPFSRNLLQQWLEQGAILINGQSKMQSYKLKQNDCVEIFKQALPSELAFRAENIALNVVFEDEDLLIIHKPVGMVCHPAPGNWQGTLVNALLHYLPQNQDLPRAGLIHRLDKMTSGLIVAAKHTPAFYYLTDQLQNRWFKRDYLAVVQGIPPIKGEINSLILRNPHQKIKMKVAKNDIEARHAKTALTEYQRLASLDYFSILQAQQNIKTLDMDSTQVTASSTTKNTSELDLNCLPEKSQFYSLMHCRLSTGRTHQIRVHFADIGHGLLGDVLYHESLLSAENMQKLRHHQLYDAIWEDLFFQEQRQALHAASLGIILPRFDLENKSIDLKNRMVSNQTTWRHAEQIQQQNQTEYQKPNQKWVDTFEHYQEWLEMPKDLLLASLLKAFEDVDLNHISDYFKTSF